jgi:hypothetical protein
MHTVELLEHATTAAQRLGYKIRQEWLGTSGGACEIKGQKWIFLDLGSSPLDQLDLVADALRGDPGLARLDLRPELRHFLQVRRSA